jgi:hypothetical protein
MKRSYILNFLVIPVIVGALVFAFSAFSIDEKGTELTPVLQNQPHKNVASEMVANKKSTENFRELNLFTVKTGDNTAASSFARNISNLKIESSVLDELNSAKPQSMTLRVPNASGSITEVELVRSDYLPSDLKIQNVSSNGTKIENYEGGLFYTGIIKGDNSSIATFSVFKQNVMGIFSTENGNFVLGAVKDANKKLTNDYVFYNDMDAVNKPGFECGSGDGYGKYYRDPVKLNNSNNTQNRTVSPVDIYFVCDYQMYLDAGSSTTNVANFVSGAFAHVRTLYLNEGLTVAISPNLTVYTSADPYSNLTTSPEILELFGDNVRNNIPGGDLAHLLSTGHGQQLGGIAWINVLCQSYEPSSHSGKYAFSNIEGTYQPYPTYSWTVMVITHETGHNFGSNHTQACVWPTIPGGHGAIDSCVAAEQGSCFSQTRPNNNGTIMSYCHLNGAINLTRGFGPLPHDTIVERYNQALCLDNPINSSEAPVAFKLSQNYPNPFNPATNIRFALPQDGYVTLRVFDVTGREIAKLINNQYYAVGFFSVNLDASALNLASGVYLYKLEVTKDNNSVYSEIKKMVLIK